VTKALVKMQPILITIAAALLFTGSGIAESGQNDGKKNEPVSFKRRSFSDATWLQSFAKVESSKTGHRWSRSRRSSTSWKKKWGVIGSITFYSATLGNHRYKIAAGRIVNWKKYIKTVLDVTGSNKKVKMKPGIALFVDGDPMGLNEIILAREECKKLGIRFWFINESVKTGDLLEYQAIMSYLREIGAE
tara:strand:+ start:139 stop:708 length:570 start_codon:yes stop_codon:yes gene_type:complete